MIPETYRQLTRAEVDDKIEHLHTEIDRAQKQAAILARQRAEQLRIIAEAKHELHFLIRQKMNT
jgi:hypothetical protein